MENTVVVKGRPEKFTKEICEALIKEKMEKGLSIRKLARMRHWTYISLIVAIKRNGLKIPNKPKLAVAA